MKPPSGKHLTTGKPLKTMIDRQHAVHSSSSPSPSGGGGAKPQPAMKAPVPGKC